MEPTYPDWTRVIHDCGLELPAWVRHRVREIGPSARVQLVQMFRAANRRDLLDRPGDFACHHVATLLEEFPIDEALMVLCLERIHAEPDTSLAFDAATLLIHAGSDAGPAALAAYARIDTHDATEARLLADVLANCGARDEAAFTALMDALERFPSEVAKLVGHYGDVRAVEPLLKLLDRLDVSPAGDAIDDWSETCASGIRASLAMLGAELTPGQAEKLDAVYDDLDEDDETLPYDEDEFEEPFEAAPRPAPNAPCRCGSGRKYKKCHMAADEEQAARGGSGP